MRGSKFNKIQQVLKFVWESPYSSFYREKYQKAGVELAGIKSIDDFKKIPYLTKQEILAVNPEKRFYEDKSKGEIISVSHGTTIGSPMVFLRTKDPLPYGSFFSSLVLQTGVKRIMLLRWPFSYQFIYRHPDFSSKKIQKFLGNIYDLKMSVKIIKELKIDGLSATPTILFDAIPYFKEEGILEQIKYIGTGGEGVSKEKFQYFKDNFPNAFIKFGFANTEAGHLGYQCPYLADSYPVYFHPLKDHLYYEVLNNKGENELVVTTLFKSDFPLIRYKTGDSVLLEYKKCPCKETTRIKVIGRIGFYNVKVGDYFITEEAVGKAIAVISGYLSSPDWRLEIAGKSKFRLKLTVVVKKAKADEIKKREKEILDRFSGNLILKPGTSLKEAIKKGDFKSIALELTESFPFTIKQRPIIRKEL